MAYYRGDYYRGGRGDYYRSRGDFLSALKGIGGVVGNLLPQSWTPQGARKAGLGLAGAALGAIGGLKAPAAAASVMRAFAPAAAPAAGVIDVGGVPMEVIGRRRRINPANARALGRALSRVSAFGRLAQRARKSISKASTAVGIRRGAAMRFGGKKR
jgi:hypothetical protein